MKSAIIVGVMAAVSALLRFLPFVVFRKRTPPTSPTWAGCCPRPSSACWWCTA